MKKHGIRAPRKPRGENKAITIANQDKQIKLLIDRCGQLSHEQDELLKGRDEIIRELRKELDQLGRKVSFQMADIARLTEARDKLGESYDGIEQSYYRLFGWQDCAREILLTMHMPLFPKDGGPV